MSDVEKRLRSRANASKQLEGATPGAMVLAETWMKMLPRGGKNGRGYPIEEVIGAAHMVMLEGLTRKYPDLDQQLAALIKVVKLMSVNLRIRDKLHDIVADMSDGKPLSKEEILAKMQEMQAREIAAAADKGAGDAERGPVGPIIDPTPAGPGDPIS